LLSVDIEIINSAFNTRVGHYKNAGIGFTDEEQIKYSHPTFTQHSWAMICFDEKASIHKLLWGAQNIFLGLNFCPVF
jgi:hypothetical protein